MMGGLALDDWVLDDWALDDWMLDDWAGEAVDCDRALGPFPFVWSFF